MRAYLTVVLGMLVGLVGVSAGRLAAVEPPVELIRLPEGGAQPEVAVGASGVLHVVYLAGDPMTSDVFYIRSSDGGRTFSPPVRVNSQPGSAIAAGTIRGAHVAVAPNGRVHVVWNGSNTATPKPPVNPKTSRTGMPMLYARSTSNGRAFEAQRNLMTHTTDLDGGGSIAADGRGVYVAWHANGADGEGGEAARRVYLARSQDEGATFERERPVSDPATGACGCCGIRLASVAGELRVLYRSASSQVHRDIYSLTSKDRGATFDSRKLHEWQINACPMTSMAVASAPGMPPVLAWETDGQVYFASTKLAGAPRTPEVAAAGPRRRHPRLAVAPDGTVLMVWTEIGSRTQPGSAGWQAFSATGAPLPIRGTAAGIPPSSFATAFARPDGSFVVLY